MPDTTIALTPDNPIPFRVFDNGDGTYSLAVIDVSPYAATLPAPGGGYTQGPMGPAGATGPAGPAGPAGPPGPAGADGLDGLDGEDGADGAPGSRWFYGSGPPPNPLPGSYPGDMYLDLSTGEVWAVPAVQQLTVQGLNGSAPRSAPTEGVRALTA